MRRGWAKHKLCHGRCLDFPPLYLLLSFFSTWYPHKAVCIDDWRKQSTYGRLSNRYHHFNDERCRLSQTWHAVWLLWKVSQLKRQSSLSFDHRFAKSMGVEGQRKKLMANGPTWGDRLAHVAGGPCEGPDLDDNICNCDVEALTPIVLMNNVTPPPPPATHILTRGWTFNNILKKGKRFREVPRVALKEATKAVVKFDRDGVPLIIEGLHEEPNWPKEDFHPDWLKNYGPKGLYMSIPTVLSNETLLPEISARNIYDRTDKTMLFDQFIEQCRSASTFASPEGGFFVNF